MLKIALLIRFWVDDRMAFGSPLIRLDLVAPDVKVEAGLNKRGLPDFGHLFTFPHFINGGSFAKVKTIGPLIERTFLSRNNEVRGITSSFSPMISNSELIHFT